MKIEYSVCLVLLLAGCISPHVTGPAAQGVNLRQFKTVKLVVDDSVNTDDSQAGVPMFEGLLKGRLKSMGYAPVETNAEMVQTVNIHEFTQGSRTLRMLVGLGAGRALLKYTATFRDGNGSLLGELEGGKEYHGMELADSPTFKSNESMEMGLVSYSVSQVVHFIQTNGGSNGQQLGRAGL